MDPLSLSPRFPPPERRSGYALVLVMAIVGIASLVLAATVGRTMTNAKMTNRTIEYTVACNAAEAATEKAVTMIGNDFQNFGLGAVYANASLYRAGIPNEDTYWTNFVFMDGNGHTNQTYVTMITNNYTGSLPSQYPGLFTTLAPIYRIISNAQLAKGGGVVGTAQEDVLLALVPITQYAIFYNGLLEFSTCATMTVNGRVHANGSIYTGTGASLTFNGVVTTTGTLSSPAWNGQGPSWNDKGTFNGSPPYRTNVPSVALSIGSTNVHRAIEIPPTGEDPMSSLGQTRLYNEAQTVLLVSNSTVTMTIQASVNYQVPGADAAPIKLTYTNNPAVLATNLPFLSTTNSFTDQRENKTVQTTQIDVGKYSQWIKTNSSILTKFPTGSGAFPTILYVADNRTTTSSQINGVRLTNGVAPPVNGGLGWSVATPNPLYVQGHYNCTNASYLGTTNTTSSVPCALMSDALTILSGAWKDNLSSSSYTSRTASDTTVDAAILTGIVPSTGSSSSQFSGGVHNLPRLLEDWNSPSTHTLTLNTAIMNLFNSTIATHAFVNPGTYYDPPTRQFSYDLNFMDPAKQPPGIPCALVLVRLNWACPPPNTITYNVTP
jgi:Tfp pilus assembly protein PilX